MNDLLDLFQDKILEAIIKTAKKIYGSKLNSKKINDNIHQVFIRFEKSSCVSLDFEECSEFFKENMGRIFNIYTDPLTNYKDNIRDFEISVKNHYPNLPREDLEFVKAMFNRVLSCVEWIVTDCLPQNEKVIINRINAVSTPNTNQEEPFTFHKYAIGIRNPNNHKRLFSYDNNDILVGRDQEISQLMDFLKDNRKLLFWVICGPGGSGKNKIVHQLFKTKNLTKAWSYRFVDTDYLKIFTDLSSWDCKRNLCLIVDDAEVNYKLLKIWFIKLFSCSKKRSFKLRIILLARGYENDIDSKENLSGKFSGEDANEIYYPDWFKNIINSSIFIKKGLYHEDFLFLPDMGRNDAIKLVSEYYKWRCDRSISTKELKTIESVLLSNNQFVLRPLSILVAVETFIARPDNWKTKFNISDVYEMLYDRYCNTWFYKIQNKEVFEAIIRIYAYATIMGGWNRRIQLLPNFLLNREEIIYNNCINHDKNKYFATLFGIITESRSDGDYLNKCVPDMFGEYYVLKVLSVLPPREFLLWMEFIAGDAVASQFIRRIVGDFGNNDTFKSSIDLIIIRLIQVMKTSIENENVAEIVSTYFSNNTILSSIDVRRALNDNVIKIKEHKCWLEVYAYYILHINVNQPFHFLESYYKSVMALCRHWGLDSNALLASKTLILLGELLRYSIAEYSSSNTENIVKIISQYANNFREITKSEIIKDHIVKESLIIAESRILEEINSLNKDKILSNEDLHSFSKELERNLISYFDYYITSRLYDDELLKLLECVGRLLGSQNKNSLCHKRVMLDKMLVCIEQAQNPLVYWTGVPSALRVATASCAVRQRNAKSIVRIIFSCIKRIKTKIIDNEEDIKNDMLMDHIDTSINRFFYSKLIDNDFRDLALENL